MPYSSKKRSGFVSRPLAVALVIILLILAGTGTFLYLHHKNTKPASTATSSSSKIDLSPASPANNSVNNDRKGSSTPSTTLDSGSTSKPPAPQATFTAQIVSANVANDNLHIGTLVSGTTTGNCVLTATKSGQPTLHLGTSTVKQDVNAYDCGVFNIPTSQFPTGGSWQISLTVTSGGASNTDKTTVSI